MKLTFASFKLAPLDVSRFPNSADSLWDGQVMQSNNEPSKAYVFTDHSHVYVDVQFLGCRQGFCVLTLDDQPLASAGKDQAMRVSHDVAERFAQHIRLHGRAPATFSD